MADATQDKLIEAARFRQNKEAGIVSQDDEAVLERIADYMMVEADNLVQPQTAQAVRDVANQIIKQKAVLASGGGAAEELPPEEGLPLEGSPIPPNVPLGDEGQVPLPPV